MKLELVLIDKDELYLEIISEYIVKNSNLFNVVCFTAVKYFKEYLKKKIADIVLLGEAEEIIEKVPEKTLLLDWGNEVEKYQRVDDMLEQIMLKYAQKTGDMRGISIGEKEAEIITVYSPIGGSGKTTLALALASIAQSKGINTIYFNLEQFSSVPNFFKYTEGNGLSEIFLSVKEKNPNIIVNILKNKLVEKNSKIAYFSPLESQSEIKELETEDIRYLFSEIKKIEEIQLIVVDLSTDFDNKTVEILNNSNKILTPMLKDGLSDIKLRQFYNELDIHYSENDLRNRIFTVINKSDEINGLNNEKISIPFIREAKTKDLKVLGEIFKVYLEGFLND